LSSLHLPMPSSPSRHQARPIRLAVGSEADRPVGDDVEISFGSNHTIIILGGRKSRTFKLSKTGL
jgi:hypothetical protein